MPGPVVRMPALPVWADPKNRSVFDAPGQGLLRTLVGLLGLDDPNQVMAVGGTPMEVGPSTGGLAGLLTQAYKQRFAPTQTPTYRAPTLPTGQPAPPFYSRLDEAVQQLPTQTFGPRVAGIVQKGHASAEEMAARQVPAFVEAAGSKPIPRAALEAHLAEHPVPQVQVKVRRVAARRELAAAEDAHDRLAYAFNTNPLNRGIPDTQRIGYNELMDAYRRLDELKPKFATYQVPGGEQYRETLITLPQVDPAKIADKTRALSRGLPDGYTVVDHGRRFSVVDPQGNSVGAPAVTRESAIDRAAQLLRTTGSGPSDAYLRQPVYTSPHFNEPNIIVHTRSNERDLPGLGRGTFLEEVQSDWHQEGKAQGYRSSDPIPRDLTPAEKVEKGNLQMAGSERRLSPEMNTRLDELQAIADARFEGMSKQSSAVPDAPFKETWPDLALKHHLAEAAQNPRTQWLGFTSSDVQINRYGTERLTWAKAKDGWYVSFEPQVGGDALAGQGIEDLGAEAARRGLVKDASTTIHSIDDLRHVVGGSEVKAEKAWKRIQAAPDGGTYLPRAEGMKQKYDVELKNNLEKIVKPFGGTVEQAPVSAAWAPPEVAAKIEAEGLGEAGPQSVPAWIVRLTPAIKDRILKEGFPLMAGAPFLLPSHEAAPTPLGGEVKMRPVPSHPPVPVGAAVPGATGPTPAGSRQPGP